MSLATQLTVGSAASVMRVPHHVCVCVRASVTDVFVRGHLMEHVFGPSQICLFVPCYNFEAYEA